MQRLLRLDVLLHHGTHRHKLRIRSAVDFFRPPTFVVRSGLRCVSGYVWPLNIFSLFDHVLEDVCKPPLPKHVHLERSTAADTFAWQRWLFTQFQPGHSRRR